MSKRHRHTFILVTMLVLATLALGPLVQPREARAQSYTLTDLGTLGGVYSAAYGINASGQVVGWSYTTRNGDSRAFLHSGGVMKNLNRLIPALDGLILQEAWAINDAGQIVANGTYGTSGPRRAFLLTPTLSDDYTLSNSGGITVTQGGTGSNSITATLASGSVPSVSFSLSGLPSGATASFNPTACTPTCSTELTISTSSSIPTGTFPIIVTGTPLGRTTTFNLVVASQCPVVTAVGGAPDMTPTLSAVYGFRDAVLAATPTGQRYISFFYTHSAEAVWLMLRYPALRTSSRLLLERYLPTLQAVVEGRPASLTGTDLRAIDTLLAAFAARASTGFRADLQAVRQELWQPAVLGEFGITVTRDR